MSLSSQAEVSGKRSKSAKEILDEKPAKKMKETSSSSASSVTSSTGKSQSSKPKKNVAVSSGNQKTYHLMLMLILLYFSTAKGFRLRTNGATAISQRYTWQVLPFYRTILRSDKTREYKGTISCSCTASNLLFIFSLQVLEEIIRSGDESDSDIYKVPSLGKHYSLKWLNLDNAWDDKKEAIKEPEKKRGLSAVNSVSDKSRGNRKRKDSKWVKDCFDIS